MTEALADLINRCLGRHPYARAVDALECWVISSSHGASAATQERLWALLDDHEVEIFEANGPTMLFRNGSRIRFRTIQQDPFGICGAQINVALFDAPPSTRVLEEICRRMARNGIVMIWSDGRADGRAEDLAPMQPAVGSRASSPCSRTEAPMNDPFVYQPPTAQTAPLFQAIREGALRAIAALLVACDAATEAPAADRFVAVNNACRDFYKLLGTDPCGDMERARQSIRLARMRANEAIGLQVSGAPFNGLEVGSAIQALTDARMWACASIALRGA